MTDHPTDRTGRGIRALAPLLLLLSLFGGIVGVTVPTAPAVAATAVRPCPHRSAQAGIYGVVPSQAPFGCSTTPSSGAIAGMAGSLQPSYQGGHPPLLYAGGAVVGTPSTTGENTVHAIFWAPTGYAFPSGYEAGITTFLTDVAAASGKASNAYAVLTQYTDGQAAGTPHIRYDVHSGTPVHATDGFPTSGGCTPDGTHAEGYTACITDVQMHVEINSVITANSLPTGMGDIYVLVFPPAVETCTDTRNAAASGNCSDTNFPGFCAYHSAFVGGSSLVLYANIPFPTAAFYSCLGTEAPNGSLVLDSALSTISHEHNETVTDPFGTAWIDSVGNENGDECAWNFGTALNGPAGAHWNQAINGHAYYLQTEFSNEDYAVNPANGCALTQPVPTASFTVTTAQPVSASPVSVDGSTSNVSNLANGISSWSWDFGDSTGAAVGISPAHTYATGGNYSVTLTVTDTDGFTGVTSHAVVVATAPPKSPPVFTSASPPGSVTAGTRYHAGFAASGSPSPTFNLSGAPAWLSVSTSTGAVSGVPPNGTTSFSYSVNATNAIAPSATVGPFVVTVDSRTSGQQSGVHGYWLVGADGGIFSFGSAGFFGSTGNFTLQRPVVGISPTADRNGYWLVASDGGVFAFGDAGYYGSLPGLGFAPAGDHSARHSLAAPIVAMVPSSDDAGYYMVAADGGVFAFGDARFAGSCPGIGGCSGTAVAVMPDASGNGYWLVTAGGSVYAFGDASYLGGPPHRSVPVTSAVRTPDGNGYWVLSADGKVFGFGDAANHGDPAGTLGGDTASAVFATADGGGYWVATAAGAVGNFGDAPAYGGMTGAHLNAPVIAASGW
jgi:PKD repeat protein